MRAALCGGRLVGAAALAAAVAVLYVRWPTEERAIVRRLDTLATALSAPAADNGLGLVARVAELRGYFAPDVRVRVGSHEVASREALVAMVGRWTPPPGGAVVEFVDAEVTLAADRRTAAVSLTATVSTRDARTGETVVDAREARAKLAKQDGKWVLTAVESAETLERP
jgi:hypothetical protein